MTSNPNLKARDVLPLMALACSDAGDIYDLHAGREGAALELLGELHLADIVSGIYYAELIKRLPATDKSLSELETELGAVTGNFEWRKLFRLPLSDHPFYGQAKLAAALLSGWKDFAAKQLASKNTAALFRDYSWPAPDAAD
jgi:hypothetical protein